MKSLVSIKEGSLSHWAIRLTAAAAVFGLVLWIPTRAGGSTVTLANETLVLMMAAMSLNLVLGYTGQISIGHSAFYGVGAYTTGILISRYDWNPWLTFVASFAVAFVVGVIVSFPASRIKGVYLALVTLALALVFPSLLRWSKLNGLTGGGKGLPLEDAKVPTTGFDIGLAKRGQLQNFEVFGWDPFGDLRKGENKAVFIYWIAVVATVLVYLVCRGIVKSRVGRSLIAIRDNETAAAVMGVNLTFTKAMVFGVSAGLCAIAGTVTSLRIGTLSPEIATLQVAGAISFLIIMVVGGAGSLWGPVVGAVIVQLVLDKTGTWDKDENLPTVVRPILGFAKTPPGTGIFAVALIVLMFFAPRGLVGLFKQYSPRLVRVIPRSAGRAGDPATALPLAVSNTTQGETT